MSGSEGKQNNRMSPEDIEAEEMAQELMRLEMYEEGMSYDDMKNILQFIDDSKNMAGIDSETRSSQEPTSYSQEMAASETVAKNSSTHDVVIKETPKLSFSYRQASGRASPIISGRKTSRAILPVQEMSVTSPDMFETDETTRPGIEREATFDPLIEENNSVDNKTDAIESKPQKSTKNVWLTDSSQGSQSGETNVNENVKSRKNQRVERWKLDPRNSVIEENDVPLKQRNRPVLNERIPYRFCHNEKIFEDGNLGDKVLQALSHALEEVADVWRRKHRPDPSELQWGSPIKVGANSRSLDKKPIIEDEDSPPRCEFLKRIPDSGQRRNMERNCKRKAAETIRNVVGNQIESEDDDDLFDRFKKYKKSDEPWKPMNKSNVNVNLEKGLTRQEKIFNNIHKPKSNKSDAASVVSEYDSDDFDNDDLTSLRLKNKKKDVNPTRRSNTPEVPFIKRRIVPPNPSKPKPRARKNVDKPKRTSPRKKNMQVVLEKNKNLVINMAKGKGKNQTVMLDDDENRRESETETIEDDDTDVEVKPLAVKGLASRMQQGMSRLLDFKRAEKQLEESRIEEELKRKARETTEREKLQAARLEKEKQEHQEKSAKEMEIKAKEQAFRKAEAKREKERRRRQAREKQQTLEKQTGHLLMDDDDGNSIVSEIDAAQRASEERVQCPICHLEFTAGEIQAHAADCNQFDDDLNIPGTSRSPADNGEVTITNEDDIYDCNICSHYSTNDGIIYEHHVNECVKRRANMMESRERNDSQATVVLEGPTSPPKYFTPISEQTESSINYAEQFPQRQQARPNKSRARKWR